MSRERTRGEHIKQGSTKSHPRRNFLLSSWSGNALSNWKWLFTLKYLICPKMFWKWETAAVLMLVSAFTMWPLSSLMERKVFRAPLSGKTAHIVLFFWSPFFNHRTRDFCLIRNFSAPSIALKSASSFWVSSIAACSFPWSFAKMVWISYSAHHWFFHLFCQRW